MLDIVLAGVTGLLLAVVLSRPPKAPTPVNSEPQPQALVLTPRAPVSEARAKRKR